MGRVMDVLVPSVFYVCIYLATRTPLLRLLSAIPLFKSKTFSQQMSVGQPRLEGSQA